MKKQMLFKAIIAICVVFLAILAITLTPKTKPEVIAFPGIPDTEDSKLIRETIIQSYIIEGEAAMTFDTSSFSTVFVDDSRGAELSPSQLKFVQTITQQKSKTDFGYLTYKETYFTWWGQGAIAMEELQAKALREKRTLTNEEMQSLLASLSGMLPPARAESLEGDPNINFISITVNGDQSVAKFDDGLRTNEMTLIKLNEKWLISGNTILALHP